MKTMAHFGIAMFKGTVKGLLVALAFTAFASPAQAAAKTAPSVYNTSATVEQRVSQEAAEVKYHAQAVKTAGQTASTQLSEDLQVIILLGMLVALHLGSSWVIKQGKEEKLA